MSQIQSRVNTRSEEFLANTARMEGLVGDLRDQLEEIKRGGGEKYQDRHQSRGKLLVRDRINALVDPGSPFLELSQLAAREVYGENVAAAGIITGIGHGQKAPARPDHSRAEPPSLYLPGRFRWCKLTQAG